MRLLTRADRYSYLREQCGFLACEAKEYSKLAWKQIDPKTGESICPYFVSEILAPRRLRYHRFKRHGGTDEQWTSKVRRLYKRKKWFTVIDRKIHGRLIPTRKMAPWKAVHEARDEWQKRDPQYTSPWIKKHRDQKRLETKLNKKLNQKQDYGYIPRGQKRAMEDIERTFWGKPL